MRAGSCTLNANSSYSRDFIKMKQQTVEIKFCRKMEVIHRRHESCVSLRTDKHVECLIKLVLATLACDRLFYWCIMSFYATLARPGTDSEVFIIDWWCLPSQGEHFKISFKTSRRDVFEWSDEKTRSDQPTENSKEHLSLFWLFVLILLQILVQCQLLNKHE